MRQLLLHSVVRALIGEVSSDLMGVYVYWVDKSILLKFFYDKYPSDENVASAHDVLAEVTADIPSGYEINLAICTREDCHRAPESPGFWIFRRREFRGLLKNGVAGS